MRTVPASSAAAALTDPSLLMPGDDLLDGPTRNLRRAMARFRDGDGHQQARADTEAEIARLHETTVRSIVQRRAAAWCDAGQPDAAATIAPAAAVAEALGLLDTNDDGAELVRQLTKVGNAIVAGVPADGGSGAEGTDEDADALLAACDRGTSANDRSGTGPADGDGDGDGDGDAAGDGEVVAGAVARVSILHQTRGATGALINAILTDGDARGSAVAATRRTAAQATTIEGFGPIGTGETVAIELDRATEFGHGAHQCPGREVAMWIASTVVEVINASRRDQLGSHARRSTDGST